VVKEASQGYLPGSNCPLKIRADIRADIHAYIGEIVDISVQLLVPPRVSAITHTDIRVKNNPRWCWCSCSNIIASTDIRSDPNGYPCENSNTDSSIPAPPAWPAIYKFR